MARDIVILGINQKDLLNGLKKVWTEERLPESQLDYWREQLQFPAIDLLRALEDHFWEQFDWESAKTQRKLGFLELVSFRSRANSLALVLSIHYFKDHFKWEKSKTPRFAMQDGCALLSPGEIAELMEWICAVSASFVEGIDRQDQVWALQPEYIERVEAMKQQSGFDRADFADFGEVFPLAISWRQTVQDTLFGYYYLVDSY